ncbi:MAG: flagellar protein FlaG [Desulfovibrio sp.]|jgi:uncharacterized FlaG/YvyC family protein|nr:flagellar protein FlaG [Desulfovibrio sp.]
MNINPSDTDVRQGFSLAQNAYAVQPASPGTQAAGQERNTALTAQTTNGTLEAQTDAKSQTAAAAADKMTAQETAQKLQQQLRASGTDLKIRVLDDSESQVQVEIVDEKSNKVLRKIPQDDLLKLSASIKEMTGVLLNNPA